jgi:hypothetical protein
MLLRHSLLPPPFKSSCITRTSHAVQSQISQQQFLETADVCHSPSPPSRSPKVSFAADVHSPVPGADFPALSEGRSDDSSVQSPSSDQPHAAAEPEYSTLSQAAADDDAINVSKSSNDSKYISLYSMPMREKVSQVLPCIFAGPFALHFPFHI